MKSLLLALALALLPPLAAQEMAALAPASGKPKVDRRSFQLILKTEAQVTQEFIQLGDLLEFVPTFVSGDIVIQPSPNQGGELTLLRSEVEAALRARDPHTLWALQGAEKCVIKRDAAKPMETIPIKASIPAESTVISMPPTKTEPVHSSEAPTPEIKKEPVEVTEAQLFPILEGALAKFTGGEGSAKIIRLLGFRNIPLPAEDGILNLELISPNSATRFGSALLEVNFKNRPSLRRNLGFEWEWKKPVWVARESQTAGHIQTEGFILEPRNILAFHGDPLPSKEIPTNLTLLRPVAKGEPLLSTNVKVPLAVTRGATVTAQVSSGPMIVSMSAVALENGTVGQTIHIQNPRSRKELVGKVLPDGIVEVIP